MEFDILKLTMKMISNSLNKSNDAEFDKALREAYQSLIRLASFFTT